MLRKISIVVGASVSGELYLGIYFKIAQAATALIFSLSHLTQKTDSCTSCACGHVFEHCKLIGGKRFSGKP